MRGQKGIDLQFVGTCTPHSITNWIAPSNNDVNGRLVKNQPKHCLYCQTNFFLTKLTTMVPWGNLWKIHSWENFQRRASFFFFQRYNDWKSLYPIIFNDPPIRFDGLSCRDNTYLNDIWSCTESRKWGV